MHAISLSSTHRLQRGEMLRIESGEGTLVQLAAGELWITQTGDPKDSFLEAGETLTLDRPGLTIVAALQPSRLRILAPEQPQTAMQRAIDWLRRQLRPALAA